MTAPFLLSALLAVAAHAEPFEVKRVDLYTADGFGMVTGAFSPDGRLFAAGFYAATPVRIFDTTTWKEDPQSTYIPFWTKIKDVPHESVSQTQVAFTPDGKKLVFGAHARKPYGNSYTTDRDALGYHLYDLAADKVTWSAKPSKPKYTLSTAPSFALSEDGRWLLYLNQQREWNLADLTRGTEVFDGSKKYNFIHGYKALFLQDALFVAPFLNLSLKRYAETEKKFTGDCSGPALGLGDITALAATRSGARRRVAVAGSEGRVSVYEIPEDYHCYNDKAPKELFSFTPGSTATGLAFSPNGWLLAVGEDKGPLTLWDVEERRKVFAYDKNMSCGFESYLRPREPVFSPDGARLAYLCGSTAPVLFHIKGAAPGAAKDLPTPKPEAPARLTLAATFSDPSGDGILDAEETASVAVTVKNEGPGRAFEVRLKSEWDGATPPVDAPATEDLGRLEPGASASRTLSLVGRPSLTAGAARLKLTAVEVNGFDADPVILEFKTRAFMAPKLVVTGLVVGGSGVVKAGESTPVTVTLTNDGEGPATGVRAQATLGSSDIFATEELTADLGNLIPGESKKFTFQFFVNKRFKGRDLPVALRVSESRGAYGWDRPLGLALGEAAPPLVVSVAGRASARPVGVAAGEAAPVEDLDAPPAAKTALDPDAVAVVIGIERYRDVPGVEYAARDAQSIHAYLTKSMGFDARNVRLLQNERATRTDLESALGTWLRNRVTEKSRVFVFYAGHGAPNPVTGEGYLVPYDGDPSDTKTTAYPIASLYKSLAALPAREVVVALDACFSGAGGRSVLAKGARPLVNRVKGLETPGGNAVVLAAAAGDQISLSDADGQHGLLTLSMLRGLRGGADADKNGSVTVAELYGYVRPEVERAARLQNTDQTPSLFPPLGVVGARGDAVLIRLR